MENDIENATDGTASASAEDLPEVLLEEVALFLSCTEAQRVMPRVCRRWCTVFSQSVLLANRLICFREFGCDPILPARCSWNEWIDELREIVEAAALCGPAGVGVVGGAAARRRSSSSSSSTSSNQLVLRGYHPRFVLFPRHFWYPRRSLHNGFVILPQDFRFRFRANYSSPSFLADVQRVIDERRSEISRDLAVLFASGSTNGADGGGGVAARSGESRRREMIEKVICLRTLASEQIELEVICRRHALGLSLRRAREADLEYRRDQTSLARRELTRVRDLLERAVEGGPGSVDPVTAVSVADDKMLSLLPPGDMCGNDMARCEELRRACRGLITQLEEMQIESSSNSSSNRTMIHRESEAETQVLSLTVFVPAKKRKWRTAIENELEDIKRSTVDRLEALLGSSRNEEADFDDDDDDDEGRKLRAQIERALRDVAHWKG